MMNITVLTFNTHNSPEILNALTEMLSNVNTETVFITLQEVYKPYAKPKTLINHIRKMFPGRNLFYDRLFGIFSILITKVKKCDKLKVGLGPFFLPNKGFVALRIEKTVYVGCHLIHGQDNQSKRMSQIKEIFSALYNYFREIDSIIIAGDFNFRGYKNEDVHDFPNDQGTMFLNKYVNFKEPRIVHNATYKYEIGSDQYDDSRNKSWCDRIFVGSKFGVNIMDYGILDINISDHKPVMANIDINTLIEALDDDIVDTVESRAVLAKYVITSFYCFFLENLWLMIFTGLMIIFYHLVKRINNQKS